MRYSTGLFALLLVCLTSVDTRAQGEPAAALRLGSASGFQAERVEIPLTLSSSAPVQGLAAIFEFDDEFLEGIDLVPAATLDIADTVVRRVESSYMVLGVVVDSDGIGVDALPVGADVDLATATILCRPGDYGQQSTVLAFVDGRYAAAEDGAVLDNVVVIDGRSVSATEGLELSNGEIICTGRSDVVFQLTDGLTAPGDSCGDMDVILDNPSTPIEGYEIAVAHPDGLTLQSISIEGTAAEDFGAEFAVIDVFAGGGTLGVILDIVDPFEGQVIPPGTGRSIARLTYCCDRPQVGADAAVFEIRFVDDELGTPPKSNVVVVGGMSRAPELIDGTFTCLPISEICDDDEDNDGDGAIDCDDEDCDGAAICSPSAHMLAVGDRELDGFGFPLPLEGQLGESLEVSFFYKSPEDHVAGGPQFDQVQGISMVLCYPCGVTCDEDSFDVSGTIVEAVGVDFVSFQCDNDPNDGDGCELILGLLVDALPPFDGATLPPTDDFWRLGSATFFVEEDSGICGRCLPFEFCDGANGRGSIPIRNLIAAENQSFRPQVMNSEVCVINRPVFYRGDCDFSQTFNIVDAAAVVFALFGRGEQRFDPPCDDACDSNDDGRIDIVDAATVILFLFADGEAPPPPGPGWAGFGNRTPPGEDPTPDELGCVGGSDCAN